MSTKTNDFLREFNRLEKELNDLYHDVALKMGISDSAFSIFYILYTLGDGCLQKDICYEIFANKQTVNSSIRKLEKDGYIYLKQGRGRDKHIFFDRVWKTVHRKTYYSSCPKRKRCIHISAFGRTKRTFAPVQNLY